VGEDGGVTGLPAEEISKREAEVLALVVARLSNAEIARKLVISVRTVESHVSSLLRKCGVADRRALAACAPADYAAAGRATGSPPAGVAGLSLPSTTFIGRDVERQGVVAALDGARLLTLVGPGGVGKTRLAQELITGIAARFAAGVAFVDLVAVRTGSVAPAVAAVLGVVQGPQQTLEEAIVGRLGGGRSLLVLDNCEHLLDGAAELVERVLSACPEVTVIATSRERLGLSGEQVVPVGPLVLGSDAESLFCDRASAAMPGFSADRAIVAQICARLDGMPLAIELAAARSASLGTGGLLAALDECLRLLAGGRTADRRHRGLCALLDWSYDLLGEEERELFRRLAVFVGAFDLDAAVAVAVRGSRAMVADLLGRLADKSLVVRLQGMDRWRLLQTVRAYAADQLDAEERGEAQDRHLNWAAATAAQLEGRLGGQRLDDFDAVSDDLRAALAAAPVRAGDVPHRLARSLARLSYARRFLLESLNQYRQAAQLAPTPAQAAEDLRSAAACAHVTAYSNQAFELLLAAAEQARAASDGNCQAIALAQAVQMAHRFPAFFAPEIPYERLRRLLDQAAAVGDPSHPMVAAHLALASAWHTGPSTVPPDPALAHTSIQAARATGDPILTSAGLDALTSAAINAGRLREARRITEERLALAASMDPHDPHAAVEIEDTFYVAYMDAIAAGDLPAAMAAARPDLRGELLDNHPYVSTSKLIPALVLTGELPEALRNGASMWRDWERTGRPAAEWMSPIVCAVALAYGLLGDDQQFTVWRARAVDIAGASQPRYLGAFAPFVDARVAVHTGRLQDAAALVDQASTDAAPGRYQPYARAAGAELAIVAGLPDAAQRLSSASLAARENAWAAACLARATGRLHNDTDALKASAEGWRRIGARVEHACTLLLIPGHEAEGQDELAAVGIPLPAA
jgi:predicted ATPase/DNA-binding CsgD family transcriptional regulator